jgi:hypothetical protein
MVQYNKNHQEDMKTHIWTFTWWPEKVSLLIMWASAGLSRTLKE